MKEALQMRRLPSTGQKVRSRSTGMYCNSPKSNGPKQIQGLAQPHRCCLPASTQHKGNAGGHVCVLSACSLAVVEVGGSAAECAAAEGCACCGRGLWRLRLLRRWGGRQGMAGGAAVVGRGHLEGL